ncbi:MAG: FHA domain-containing protein [Planctomycetota bacterium]|jgi:hypothetical protein
MIRIEILSGPDSGRVLELDSGTHTVGRANSNDVVLAVDSVSGRHLSLTVDGDTVRFKDLGSTNGTWSGGIQVEEGEWFAGSEIKLGSLRLKLLGEESAAAEDEDDAALHRRAREAAMSGKRKGGLLPLVALLLIVGGGASWWFFLRDDGSGGASGGGGSEGGATAAATVNDLLEGFGYFEDEGAWSLDRDLRLEEGRLVSGNARGGRARLVRRFPAPLGALSFSATVASGLEVIPHLRWGISDEEEGPTYLWQAGALGGGSEIALPESARWFELTLELRGSGAVEELLAEEGESSASRLSLGLLEAHSHGGNLLLASSEGPLLNIAGSGGQWTSAGGGLQFSPQGATSLALAPQPALLASGPALVLAGGGPLGLTNGLALEDSPGMLLGGQATRFLLRFPAASAVSVRDGAASFTVAEPVTLASEFNEDLTEAARLSQRITRAQREGDRRGLLEATDQLLRDYPFDEDKIQEALLAARGALEEGRATLQSLQERASAVLFAGSVSAMRGLADESTALADSLPGTEIAPEAQGLALVLRASADELDREETAARTAYRDRLERALAGSYPALAAWLKEVQ